MMGETEYITYFNTLAESEQTKMILSPRRVGVRLCRIIELKENLQAGFDCVVATTNPEEDEKTFYTIFGIKMLLKPIGNDLYKASLAS